MTTNSLESTIVSPDEVTLEEEVVSTGTAEVLAALSDHVSRKIYFDII